MQIYSTKSSVERFEFLIDDGAIIMLGIVRRFFHALFSPRGRDWPVGVCSCGGKIFSHTPDSIKSNSYYLGERGRSFGIEKSSSEFHANPQAPACASNVRQNMATAVEKGEF